ncbi:MAG: hypothetical protein KDK97_13095 [Verrucomicrobiales bacterium]|nr:hypothetical protein [Verrucomicrobiales bacterium]MCP5556884.1 hypothetical protein [Verrucomicrobiaceae bacterium]
MPPNPRQLFRQFDAGLIDRDQLRESMNEHARFLIDEMVENRKTPDASYFESIFNRHHANRLESAHGEPLVREVLLALSELPDFPLAWWLWDADHLHIPLHCFFRTRKEPVFRISKISRAPSLVIVNVEYGLRKPNEITREKITFSRNKMGQLVLLSR